MKNLSHLKPGDHIAIPNRNDRTFAGCPGLSNRIYKIARLTKTQIKAENIHSPSQEVTVRIADAVVIGDRGGAYVHAFEATPEILAAHHTEAAAIERHMRARQAVADLEGKCLHQLKLTTEQIEHLGKAWSEVKAMGI